MVTAVAAKPALKAATRFPAMLDPCGENGEFHTFVFAGPNFAQPVPYTLGEYTLREGRFGYRDLMPGDND